MSDLTYERVAEIERAEGFDRAAAEAAVNRALERHGILGGIFFESRNPGVLATEQIELSNGLQQAMNEAAEEIGIAITCVANCDWVRDLPEADDERDEEDLDESEEEGLCDEEATWIAFDIPSLDPSFRDDEHRNRIDPTAAEGASPRP